MPDISKIEDLLRSLEDGTYRTLGLSLGEKSISTPGERIPKKDTQPTPTLFAPLDLPQDGTYAIISLDLDAPFISWNALSPIAHWIQTGLKIHQQQRELKSDQPCIAPWAAAGPPPMAAPHRYVFLLYHQDPDWKIPQNFREKPLKISQRMRFDLDAIAKQLQLGDLAAVNYFLSN